jgi:hypothetical protein
MPDDDQPKILFTISHEPDGTCTVLNTYGPTAVVMQEGFADRDAAVQWVEDYKS